MLKALVHLTGSDFRNAAEYATVDYIGAVHGRHEGVVAKVVLNGHAGCRSILVHQSLIVSVGRGVMLKRVGLGVGLVTGEGGA